MEELYILKKSVNLIFKDRNTLLIDNNGTVSKVSGLTDSIYTAFKLFYKDTPLEELKNRMSPEDFRQFFTLLSDNRLIRKKYNNQYKDTKYKNQIDYYAEFFEDPNAITGLLKEKTVVVLGLGGVGSIVIQHLLGAGIQNYICIDNDRVNITNLNRQFCFTLNDINRDKASVMEEYIKAQESAARVTPINSFVNSGRQLEELLEGRKVDFIACCADKPQFKIRNYILEYCIKHEVPCSFCGVGVNDGNWGPLLAGKDQMQAYYNLNNRALKLHEAGNKEIVGASFGFTNTVISAFFTNDIIMHLADSADVKSADKVLQFNFLNYTVKTIIDFSRKL